MRDLGGVGGDQSFNQSNKMNINNSTHCDNINASTRIFFMVVYSLVFLVGLLLNGFTLKVYFCRAQQQMCTVTIYLKNLAAADFLISLCLPLRIINYASSSVPVRQVYCSFGASAFYLNMYASILFMGYIAANRYLKIVHPLETHNLQTKRAAHIISALTWVFLLTMMSTYIFMALLTQNLLPSVPITVGCGILHSAQFSHFYKFIHICCAIIFLVVLVSLVILYYSTSRRLLLAQQRQQSSSSFKKFSKSRRNMLVLVIVFCVCFVPYHVVRLPYAFVEKQCSWSQLFFYLKELTVMMSVLNVCLDPLIYFIFCKAFRARLGLRSKVSSTEGETPLKNLKRRCSAEQNSPTKTNRKLSLITTMQDATTVCSGTKLPDPAPGLQD
ncbi:P2Y purinoceptor 14-like [Mastacembelus armatus]|nr:P2Y purinoceptor 14-like [Mastacembelus armatus]